MRRHQENSTQTMEQKQAQVSTYFRSNFSRPAKDGEEEEAVRTGKGFRGKPMTREQVVREVTRGK